MFALVLIPPQNSSAAVSLRRFFNMLIETSIARGYVAKTPNLCLAITLLLSLTACNSNSSNSVAGQLDTGEITLAVPDRIRNVQAIDLENVIAVANVNDVDYPMSLINGRFQTTTAITVDANSSVRVNLRFSERLDGGAEIILAQHTQVTSVQNSNETIEFFNADYNTDFDRDGDSISNIDERNLGTDPLVFSPIPANRTLNVTFDLPALIPDPQTTQAIVTYAGVPKAVSRTGNRFQISGSAPTSADITIEIILLQRFNNQSVVIATATEFVTAGVDVLNILLASSDFDFDKDRDGDGRTNVQELRLGTNPFIAD